MAGSVDVADASPIASFFNISIITQRRQHSVYTHQSALNPSKASLSFSVRLKISQFLPSWKVKGRWLQQKRSFYTTVFLSVLTQSSLPNNQI
jgi:hypothetical protein